MAVMFSVNYSATNHEVIQLVTGSNFTTPRDRDT